jgi:hypothetical protein
MSQIDAPQPAATHPAEPKKASPIRLIVLLAILAVVLTGFLVDMFVMYDSVKAASLRLQAAADEIAKRPREDGKSNYLAREGVAEAIGFRPTSSNLDENGRLVEYYRWWGSLPLQRRFIMVVYEDADGERYSGYEISNRNIYGQDEDDEALQVEQQPASTDATPPTPMPVPPTAGPPGTTLSPSGGKADGEAGDSPAENNKPEPAEPPANKDESASTPPETPANDDSSTEE